MHVFDIASLGNYLVFFLSSLVVWGVAFSVYQLVTPVKELAQIQAGNTAVAINFFAVALSLALPIQSLGHSTFDLVTLVVWGLISALSQIVLHFLSRFLTPKIYNAVNDGSVPAALGLSAVVIVVGLLNAAAISF